MTVGLSMSARVATGLGALALLTACNAVPSALGGDHADSASPSKDVAVPTLTTTVSGSAVPIDARVATTVADGTLTKVRMQARSGETKGSFVPGKLAEDGTGWRATGRLEPATTYVIFAKATDEGGTSVPVRSRFTTVTLDDAHEAFPSIAPLAGETVGIGMPVIVSFDTAVENKAAFEKRMKVTSTPAQAGSWRWLSDREVHWRPATYWKPGTEVHVNLDLNSVPAGGGIYGQESRSIDFHIGDAHVYKVNAQTDQMQVYSNGALLRTLPITTGMPGFTTRSGTKVIIEKAAKHTMDSETVGIGKDNPLYYHVDDVQWTMRLTYSGEFIHAAPWSVASQGHANVSHGCTGMSTSNAEWLFNMSRRGDVVETTGTDRPMELTNGYGDWNLSFADWKSGSAL